MNRAPSCDETPMRNEIKSRMPAEWEPHASTWIGWPHRDDDWPGKIEAIHWAFCEIVRKLVPGERVGILVQSTAAQAHATEMLTRTGVDLGAVDFLPCPTDRNWLRDTGPIFVWQNGRLIARDFRFRGWNRYDDWQHDDLVAQCIAQHSDIITERSTMAEKDLVLEGGAIDVNGQGTILATEECLLDNVQQVRNPDLDRAGYEHFFRHLLGATKTIWLGRGIAGDDTHGHVDDICRFVDDTTVVLCRESNSHDENYIALEENRERLETARLADGSRPEVIYLPMPTPLTCDGIRLPASYANFYIANAVVLVPTFNDLQDRHALGILSELFSDRPVVGVNATDLIWGLGAIHCLTQQQPAT